MRPERIAEIERVSLSRILILDGHSAAALAITRSAGRGGHWVAVGANAGLLSAAKLSKYARAGLDYPVSTVEPERFADCILQFTRANSIDLVLPLTDWTLTPLSRYGDRFAGVCKLALPSESALRAASDKWQTIQLAQSVDISVPETVLVDSAASVSGLPFNKFPVVVKDRFSVRWNDEKTVFGSTSYANSQPDLERQLQTRLQVAGDVLVQKFVGGTGIGFAAFVAGQKIFLPFAWQRIREVDPRGSASSCRRSIPLDDDLLEHSSRLLLATGFEGIAMVEYKRTCDGRLILMEINGRPWGSIALPIASGLDFPQYWIDWLLTGTLPPLSLEYKTGITCRRIVGEMSHLMNLRAGKPAGWPRDYPKFWPSVARMAVPWYPGVRYDEMWLSDPRPGWAEIKNWFRVRRKKTV